MLAGSQCKTMNYTLNCYWPTEGDRRDFALYSKVGSWIGQQAKVLDKKGITATVKLIAEQFPEVVYIEGRDHQGRLAIWR